MRIKWTSIHSVVAGNPVAPWVGPGLAERLKQEVSASDPSNEKKKDLKKAARVLAWLRRRRSN